MIVTEDMLEYRFYYASSLQRGLVCACDREDTYLKRTVVT